VTRYHDIEETLNSLRFGADGELVRTSAFSGQSQDIIQVPEPIAETSFHLVCRTSESCAAKLQPNVRVGISMDILILKDWWAEEKATQQTYLHTISMLEEFLSGQLDYMILSAIDVSAYKEQLSTSSNRTILTMPFYHFINKKHESMLEDINQGLKDFKQTVAYENFQKRYWLNEYPQ
jgi:hypothetical protein